MRPCTSTPTPSTTGPTAERASISRASVQATPWVRRSAGAHIASADSGFLLPLRLSQTADSSSKAQPPPFRVCVPRLPRHSCAVEAVLGPGDTLFLPAYWWHHVHALDSEGVSLSLWYGHDVELSKSVAKAVTTAARASNREQPTTSSGAPLNANHHSLRVRVARESEEVVAAAIGPRHVRAFFRRLAWHCAAPWGVHAQPLGARGRKNAPQPPPVDYEGNGEDEAEEAEPPLRNWLLHRLGQLLGAGSVRAFVRDYLGDARFEGLP